MSSSVAMDVSRAAVSAGTARPSAGETLSALIAAAATSLYSDRDTAKRCMEQAQELLQAFREHRRADEIGTPFRRGGLATWQKRRVAAYIDANVAGNIRAEDLAREVRLSKGHFFRAFSESFGVPPMAYVARRRILHGQELLRNSQASLSEIALACGMCDQPHFTRVFHRIVGVSPGLWRHQFDRGLSRAGQAAPSEEGAPERAPLA